MAKIKVTSKICMTKDVGMNKTLFGGNMLAWMDEAAAIFARQYTGETMVTLKFSEVLFLHPVYERQIVEFYVDNPKQGRTSLAFDVEGITNEGKVVFKTSTVFVAVDENGKPKVIEKKNNQ